MVKARSGRRLRLLLCNDILVLLDENAAGLYCAVSLEPTSHVRTGH